MQTAKENNGKKAKKGRTPKDTIKKLDTKTKQIALNIYATKIITFFKVKVHNKKREILSRKGIHSNNIKHALFETSNLKCICSKSEKGLREGFGICYWKNGNVYKGYYHNDKVNGLGIFQTEGDTYQGEFQDNKLHGFCIYTHNNGAVLASTWKLESQMGIGIETWKDGSSYQGDYAYSKKDGIGTYSFVDGSKYIGEWKDNNFDGIGMYYFSDGRIYYGQWKNNMMNGFGEFYWKNGKKYIGGYVKDKKEGFGFYVWEEPKKIFMGFWKGGKQHGVGKFLDEEKTKYGLWKNGKRIKWLEEEEEINKYIADENTEYVHYFKYSLEEASKIMDKYSVESIEEPENTSNEPKNIEVIEYPDKSEKEEIDIKDKQENIEAA